MTSLKNLPPHVVRELRRHIAPSSRVATAAHPPTGAPTHPVLKSRPTLRSVLVGCTLFTAAAASLPVVLYYWVGGLNDRDSPLTAPQVRRGAFNNSGTRDVGRDPEWNFASGTHAQQKGYGGENNNNNANNVEDQGQQQRRPFPLPGEYHAMSNSDMQKHQDKIEAFAHGKGKNN